MKYIMRQNIVHRGSGGGGWWVVAKFFLSVFFGKTLIADKTQMIKTYFFFVKQISDNLKNTHGQNYLVAYVRLPITPP